MIDGVKEVGVVGAGAMGAGVAQVAAAEDVDQMMKLGASHPDEAAIARRPYRPRHRARQYGNAL